MSCQVQRHYIIMDPGSSSKKTSRSSRQQQQRQPQVPAAELGFDYTQTAFDVPVTNAAAASYVMSPSYSYDAFGASPDMSLYIPGALPETAQVNWASMDAAAYTSSEQQQAVAYSSPEQQSVYLDSASYSETTDEQPQIEIEMVDNKPKARKRPNRYKNAHPIVKERRREQNREAQRKYRERKDQRIVELEELLKNAQKQNETLSQAYVDLQVEHQHLLRQATKSPSEITDEDPGEGPSGTNR